MENQAGNIPDEATGNKITWGNTTLCACFTLSFQVRPPFKSLPPSLE